MTQDEIIEMARQVCDVTADSRGRESFDFDSYGLKAFAKLVATKEREACAKIAEPKKPRPCDCECCDCGNSTSARMVTEWDESSNIAIAIRARGKA